MNNLRGILFPYREKDLFFFFEVVEACVSKEKKILMDNFSILENISKIIIILANSPFIPRRKSPWAVEEKERRDCHTSTTHTI